ncbi:MAG: hypothetical protein SOW08_07615 [Lachnospiraceae bacterium]|nr:hypothetical protein [Lachnospiraceae bacterium]
MKKIITFLVIAGMVICLCACVGETKEHEGIPSEAASPADPAGGGSSSETQDPAGFRYLAAAGEGCCTEDGYYYITEDTQELSDGSYGAHIMYMDFASGQEVYLCSNAGCRHDSPDCSSVLSEEEFPAGSCLIFVHQGSLYILSKDQDMDGTVSSIMAADENGELQSVEMENRPSVLYRAEPDGTNREKVYTFDSSETLEDKVIGDEKGLYFIVKKLSSEQTTDGTYMAASESRLVFLNPETWKGETICSLDQNDDISWEVEGCYGDKLVLQGQDYGRRISGEDILDDDTWKSLYTEADDVYALLDVKSGGLHEIYRISNKEEHSAYVYGNCLYLSRKQDGSVKAVDLDTGKERQLASLTNSCIFTVVGDRLCCHSWDWTDDKTFYYVDTKTGEVSHSGLVNRLNGWSLELRGETASDALVVYDYEAEQLDEDTYEISRYQYGLISKEDLYAGNDNYRTIKMIGSGR